MEMEQNIWYIPKGRQKQEPELSLEISEQFNGKSVSVANAPTERNSVNVYKTYAEKRPSSIITVCIK